MLKMERKIGFFVLATSILLCARRGNAFVPQPYEELLSNLADKYGESMDERNLNTRGSSGMLNLFRNGYLNRVNENMMSDLQIDKKLNNFINILLESMESCALSTLEKCNAMSDNQRPKNMIEVSGYNFRISLVMD